MVIARSLRVSGKDQYQFEFPVDDKKEVLLDFTPALLNSVNSCPHSINSSFVVRPKYNF